MTEQQKTENMTGEKSLNIIRKGHLAEKIVIVDGHPGCGKTMLSPIISSLDRVELVTYAFEVEYICRLYFLDKIKKDAAVTLVRIFTDLKLYRIMMGRDINFRFTDISSVFRNSNPWRYFRRIFQKGDEIIPERIKKVKPILNLATHNLLGYSEPIFSGLGNRVVLIEVVRHPLYMIKQQTLNMERLLDNPRDTDIYFEYKGKQIPYYSFGWEDLFICSNNIEKTIYTIDKLTQLNKELKKTIKEKYNGQILTIPFERFVLEPWPYMKKIENALDTCVTLKTKKMMKKQNVPRKMYGEGIPLEIYKRCGWEPPEQDSDEEREFEKRRGFVRKNVNGETFEVLERLCSDYEKQYLQSEIPK